MFLSRFYVPVFLTHPHAFPDSQIGHFCLIKREEEMLYKAGTLKEMKRIVSEVHNMPKEVCGEALRLAKILDDLYGTDRDVDISDGGFVLVIENIEDVQTVSQKYVRLDDNRHEAVDVLKCESEVYINAFFLCNNEFGINVLMPINIAPKSLREEARERVT
jgi:hypothetical protein